jgi:hypothetical protein
VLKVGTCRVGPSPARSEHACQHLDEAVDAHSRGTGGRHSAAPLEGQEKHHNQSSHPCREHDYAAGSVESREDRAKHDEGRPARDGDTDPGFDPAVLRSPAQSWRHDARLGEIAPISMDGVEERPAE